MNHPKAYGDYMAKEPMMEPEKRDLPETRTIRLYTTSRRAAQVRCSAVEKPEPKLLICIATKGEIGNAFRTGNRRSL